MGAFKPVHGNNANMWMLSRCWLCLATDFGVFAGQQISTKYIRADANLIRLAGILSWSNYFVLCWMNKKEPSKLLFRPNFMTIYIYNSARGQLRGSPKLCTDTNPTNSLVWLKYTESGNMETTSIVPVLPKSWNWHKCKWMKLVPYRW